MSVYAWALRVVLTLTALFAGGQSPAQDGGAFWYGAIQQWGRPANFYRLTHATDAALCNAYLAAAAPLLVAPQAQSLSVTAADIPWHSVYDTRIFSGFDELNWMIVAIANNGVDQALIQSRSKGHRRLVMVKPIRANALLSLVETLYGHDPDPFAALEDLEIETQLAPEILRLTNVRMYPEISIRNFAVTRLLNRYYLSIEVFRDAQRGLQPFLGLVELDGEKRATLRCVLAGRYSVLF